MKSHTRTRGERPLETEDGNNKKKSSEGRDDSLIKRVTYLLKIKQGAKEF